MTVLRTIPLAGSFAGLSDGFQVIQTDAGAYTPAQAAGGVPGYMDWVSDPAGQRGTVLRSSVDSFAFPTPGNPDGVNGNRSEFFTDVEPVSAGVPVERWYSWHMLIGEGWSGAVGRRYCVMQIHDTPDGGDASRWPNLKLLADDAWIDCTLPAATMPAESVSYRSAGAVKITPGQWMRFALRAVWSIEAATGSLDLFANGAPIVRERGKATSYSDTVGPYFKLGVYNTFKHTGARCSAYFSQVQHYSAPETYGTGVGALSVRSMQAVTP